MCSRCKYVPRFSSSLETRPIPYLNGQSQNLGFVSHDTWCLGNESGWQSGRVALWKDRQIGFSHSVTIFVDDLAMESSFFQEESLFDVEFTVAITTGKFEEVRQFDFASFSVPNNLFLDKNKRKWMLLLQCLNWFIQ